MRSLAGYIPLDFLPDAMVKEHEIFPTKAGSVISLIGIASIAGPLLSGLTTNYLKNTVAFFFSLCMMLTGICCVGMAFSTLYWHFVICIFFYGLFLREIIVLIPLLLVDMFGTDSLKFSYGVTMFCSGIATLIGPPIIGWLKTLGYSYDSVFIIAGGIFVIGGFFALILLCLNKREN